ncbi:dTDP-4-dehydrorhamnose reductase [Phaeovulum sp.]|uniref:dTDP-4-dehydrorhamnose reductase n=1 Tax=Phaeovulum sp. TaxID=2934796 RepID=UPI0039E293E3
MSILVFGQTGQVAQELRRLAPNARFLGRAEADLTAPDTCARAVAESGARLIINAAAYTAVDRAEEDEPTAHLVNAAAPTAMAKAAAATGAVFLHISTDYVFDGSGAAPWAVDAPTGPLGAYGRTKLAGERGVRDAGGRHGILRTSWVFSAHGANFVKTMLRLSENRSQLSIVADQIGGPTPARAVAQSLLEMGAAMVDGRGKPGIWHYAGTPDVSWADFARTIFSQAGRQVDVIDIPTSDYPTPARRPLNSRLDCRALDQVFGIARPDWRLGLAEVLQELEGN